VNPALAIIATAVVAGAVVAVSARDGRPAVVGLALTLVFAPLIADPLDTPLALAGRLTGAVLAVYLLWIAVRGGGLTGGSRIGWPAEALLAGAAFVIGFEMQGLGSTALGPIEAQAAGVALGALAIVPLTTGRDILRVGIGLVLVLQAALLIRVGVGGTPSELEQVVTAVLIAALGGSIAALAYAARADGPDGFAMATELRARIRRPGDVRRDMPRPPDPRRLVRR